MMLRKVISGGSTGADMGALIAAKALGFETGGTLPQVCFKERAKQHRILKEYNMNIMEDCKSLKQSLVRRSMKNVDNADATIAFRLFSSIGTDKTISYALIKRWSPLPENYTMLIDQKEWYKPTLVIDQVDDRKAAAAKIITFLNHHRVKIVNVAGHRESKYSKNFSGQSLEKITREIMLMVLEYTLPLSLSDEEKDDNDDNSVPEQIPL